MREVVLERYAPAATAAEGGAALAALAAILLSAGQPGPMALLLGAAVSGVGLLARRALGEVESGIPREGAGSPPGVGARIFPFYVFTVSVTFVLFPEPFGPSSLLLLAFAQAPLLAAASRPRARTISDANAGILAAAAATAGGPFVRPCVALYLACVALVLALRHFEERARAARWDGEEDPSPALLAAGGAAALLLAVFVLGAELIPAPDLPRASREPRPDLAEVIERGRALPVRALAALALALVLPFALIWIYRKIADWLFSRAPQQVLPEATEGLALSGPEALPPPAPKAPRGPAPEKGRAAVVAAYQQLEASLAARDLGRAPSEGAVEHAGAVAQDHPAAARDLAAVASAFSSARYGPEEPPPGAAKDVRAAADRALAAIDGEG